MNEKYLDSGVPWMAKLGSLVAPKHIRSKLIPRYLTFGNVLDCRPIFRRNKRFIAQPLRNRLLTEGLAINEFRDAARQSGLASGNLDGFAQRGDVGLHGGKHTTVVVNVNNQSGVPPWKAQATVRLMTGKAATKRKEPIREAPLVRRDSQGRSLGDRLKLAMNARGQALGRAYRTKELLADAHKASGLPEGETVCSQQNYSKIVRDQISESAAVPAFAAALGINAIWLQYGHGPPTPFDAALAKRLEK